MNNNSKSLIDLSQDSICNLITRLQFLLQQYGNIPIIYWDQNSAVTFNNFKNAYNIKEKLLMFGGFHMNCDNKYDLHNEMNFSNNLSQHSINDLIIILGSKLCSQI
jgi:hypothetical protein